MSQHAIAQLIKAVQESIARAESSTTQPRDRALHRALAHLWSAHDELELLSATLPVAPVKSGRVTS